MVLISVDSPRLVKNQRFAEFRSPSKLAVLVNAVGAIAKLRPMLLLTKNHRQEFRLCRAHSHIYRFANFANTPASQ
jgi:hypothetical protein